MPVRGLEDCCGVVGWTFNANALNAIAADCAADDGTDTTESNNNAENHVTHYRDEWSLPNTANNGDICITDNNGAVWVWNGWCWRDRDGTTVIQTEDIQPNDAAMGAGGIVEYDEQVVHMDGYDAAANEEPAPVLEVGNYIYNGVHNPVDYNAIEDAMRVVRETTVRGQRARYPIIEDLNDINPVNTYTIDWDHVQIGVDADGNPTIHAHVNPVVSYQDNDNTSEVPSEEFADIFEADA